MTEQAGELPAAAAPDSPGAAAAAGPALAVAAVGPAAAVEPASAEAAGGPDQPGSAAAAAVIGDDAPAGTEADEMAPEQAAAQDGAAAESEAPEPEAGAPGAGEPADEPAARVEFRALESALVALRKPVAAAVLPLDGPGVADARHEQAQLLSQIDDYLLPRLRHSGAPVLVAMVGSTGAGKSTLVNSIVGSRISATGVRRPTTNSPVLACHPDDVRWFAENVFLPTLPRVRQQGLAMPGRDGLLVLAACEGMPRGVAILDTPDIDSVVEAHRDFARQFLDASDLWLFVTTARRYADAAVWGVLTEARDRGAALAVAMSRVPPGAEFETGAHFDAMLDANGLGGVRRFVIPETQITDSMLPAGTAGPVVDWLSDTARQADRRVAVLTQTMSGVLDTFRSRVPALADQVSWQLELRQQLRGAAADAFAAGLQNFDAAIASGSLLQGELLARWQDFAGAEDLLGAAPGRRGRAASHRRARTPAGSDRTVALQQALQTCLAAVVVATATRADEDVLASWRELQAAAQLLGEAGTGGPARAAAALAEAAGSQITAWQADVRRMVRSGNLSRRAVAKTVSLDEESLALVLAVAVLAAEAGASSGEDPGAAPWQLLETLVGTGQARDLTDRARANLIERAQLLYRGEVQRCHDLLDSAGVPDERLATELLQAGFAVEEAR